MLAMKLGVVELANVTMEPERCFVLCGSKFIIMVFVQCYNVSYVAKKKKKKKKKTKEKINY